MTLAVETLALGIFAVLLVVSCTLLGGLLYVLDRVVQRHPSLRGLLMLVFVVAIFVFGLLPPLIASPDRATAAQRHRGNIEAAISIGLCCAEISAWVIYRFVYQPYFAKTRPRIGRKPQAIASRPASKSGRTRRT